MIRNPNPCSNLGFLLLSLHFSVMDSMVRHCWKRNGFYSLRCILQRQFFYSTTSTEGAISSPKKSNSLSSLTNFLVGSLGFSEKQALYASTKLTKLRQSRGIKKVCDPNILNNAGLVINFLEQKGLDKPQIRNLVYCMPQILNSRIERTLEPKITFFEQLGLSVSEFADVIPTQCRILTRSLDSTIRPAVEALRAIMGSDENVVRVIKRFQWNAVHLILKNVVCNVSSLRAKGIPLESIQKRMLCLPTHFTRKPQDFEDIMARAEAKWGVSPCSPMFLYAVQLLSYFSKKNIESKCQVFESFGWDRSQVVDLFRRNPLCFGMSKGNIQAKLRFCMNELGYDPGFITAHLNLLTCSLEKRVLPRHRVFQILREKGLVRGNLTFCFVLRVPEDVFLRKFVLCFLDIVPNLNDIYANSMRSSSEQQTKRADRTCFSRMRLKPNSACVQGPTQLKAQVDG